MEYQMEWYYHVTHTMSKNEKELNPDSFHVTVIEFINIFLSRNDKEWGKFMIRKDDKRPASDHYLPHLCQCKKNWSKLIRTLLTGITWSTIGHMQKKNTIATPAKIIFNCFLSTFFLLKIQCLFQKYKSDTPFFSPSFQLLLLWKQENWISDLILMNASFRSWDYKNLI